MCVRGVQGEQGIAIGTMECVDPRDGRRRMLVGLSGAPERVAPLLSQLASQFPEDCVLAPPQVDPAFWAGREDPRFQPGKNPDGSPYEGDSRLCAVPRLYQAVRQRGLEVKAMSLLWKGEGPNPFPREAKNPSSHFMHPCPSCTANVGTLMQGPVVSAPSPSPSPGAAPETKSLWRRLVGLFR